MKWLFLAATLAAILPLTNWLRRNPAKLPMIWMVMGFLVFEHGPQKLYMAIVSWGGWPGHTKGAEFSIVDALAIALLLTLPRGKRVVPFLFPMGLYMFALLLSAFQATVLEPALFSAWQFARIILIYVVVARACADPRVPVALLKGMALGLLLETGLAIFQKFAVGAISAAGSFGHQNTLGLVSHFVTFPAFALLLAGQPGWNIYLVPAAGSLLAVLTTSRATLAFAAAGYALTFLISILRKWTARKARLGLACAAVVAFLAPIAIASFHNRFVAQGWSEQSDIYVDDERVKLNRAAELMFEDHPFGVGANHYVVRANEGGYNSRADMPWTSFGATVHNVYWLVATETGYFGIISFLILLTRPLLVAFFCGWRSKGDPRGDLLLGLGISLLVVYVHSLYEWIFITFQVQYVFGATIGLVGGLAQQLGYWNRARVADTRSHPTLSALGRSAYR